MRFVELLVTDAVDEPASVRTEWIHRDHIESIDAWTANDEEEDHGGGPLWLELTLTSGRVRYVPVGDVPNCDPVAAANQAIWALLEDGQLPIAAAR